MILERMSLRYAAAIESVDEAEKKAESKLEEELRRKFEINRDLVMTHRRKEERRNNWRSNLPKKTKTRRW